MTRQRTDRHPALHHIHYLHFIPTVIASFDLVVVAFIVGTRPQGDHLGKRVVADATLVGSSAWEGLTCLRESGLVRVRWLDRRPQRGIGVLRSQWLHGRCSRPLRRGQKGLILRCPRSAPPWSRMAIRSLGWTIHHLPGTSSRSTPWRACLLPPPAFQRLQFPFR